jgi:anti-sigma-K factor RskA
MTKHMAHLESDELVDALDGILPAARLAHLDACEQCREQVRQFQEMAGDVRVAGHVPDPSPLFWPHLRERVRVATGPVAPRRALWGFDWRWVGAATAAMAAVLLVAVLRHQPALPPQTDPPAAASIESPVAEQSFASVTEAAAGVSYEVLQDVAQPTSHAADALVTELSETERAEFVRLLQAEAGRLE